MNLIGRQLTVVCVSGVINRLYIASQSTHKFILWIKYIVQSLLLLVFVQLLLYFCYFKRKKHLPMAH